MRKIPFNEKNSIWWEKSLKSTFGSTGCPLKGFTKDILSVGTSAIWTRLTWQRDWSFEDFGLYRQINFKFTGSMLISGRVSLQPLANTITTFSLSIKHHHLSLMVTVAKVTTCNMGDEPWLSICSKWRHSEQRRQTPSACTIWSTPCPAIQFVLPII